LGPVTLEEKSFKSKIKKSCVSRKASMAVWWISHLLELLWPSSRVVVHLSSASLFLGLSCVSSGISSWGVDSVCQGSSVVVCWKDLLVCRGVSRFLQINGKFSA
jgi:hypothetical protein